ncbi:unnamed protein product [Didymodactylos carnosus]|uniref:alpha-glucosidase n=1 Tax=Didymodactylos carnosus TaxID=1234261 RepID=A0A814KX30_9BILA|nr:unnamed protein product [Didymodactylos carnosus]CAF1058088.1 unnamed protein product [Didymodactylos carnosus]CAF3614949.1 unnamed protein product [Didymodactylos carnosus]CAF3826787.1 unnamed protein product [Didymodactylos carnosus]
MLSYPLDSDTAITVVAIPNSVINNVIFRTDCHPDANSSQTTCEARGCIWDSDVANSTFGIVACYVPKSKGGYYLYNQTSLANSMGMSYTLSRLSTDPTTSENETDIASTSDEFSLFNNDTEQLNVSVTVSGTNMIRMKITDANMDNQRYEVPVPITWSATTSQSQQQKLRFELTQTQYNQTGLRVRRQIGSTSSGNDPILFDTTYFAEGFIYDNQFLQIITTFPSNNVYGFGENTHPSFRHNLTNGIRYGIFARDQPPQGQNENLYGTHPFYMCIEDDGNAFGVLIFNSNAQDYEFSQFSATQALLTYRTIGGILDLFFFAGPTPEEVIQQYQMVIGKPYMPPYWGLGFQLCRYGYNSLANMVAAWNRTISNGIPQDVQWGDIDTFDNQTDFTYDPVNYTNLPQFIDHLHNIGMKFVTILDPAIDSQHPNYSAFVLGEQQNIWIKWPVDENLQFNETGNQNMLGYVWPPGKAVFPDFFYPPTKSWWLNQIVTWHNTLNFDAIWIDMPWNWPYSTPWSLHCPTDEQWDAPPYHPAIWGDVMSDKTICMLALQTDGNTTYRHYDIHSLFGWSETIATLPAARALSPGRRSFVLSRSTFPSSGVYAGHWTGDNSALWPFIKYNIIGLLEFNLFGIPYIGADICGFNLNTTEELCQRWMQLGAFNPFFRNHNSVGLIDQDPGVFSPSVIASNRKAVILRYTLIPYLYTLFYNVHVNGGTVVRSMAHEYSQDSNCWGLDEQFLWGSSLLIAPVIYESQTTKNLYLPLSPVRWYDYYTGQEQTTLGNITVAAPLDYMPLFVKGGSIIPIQQYALNTNLSRQNPMSLLVALDQNQTAGGSLFWDDGDSVDTYENQNYNLFQFNYTSNNTITITAVAYHYQTPLVLDQIQVYGLTAQPTQIMLMKSNSTTINMTTIPGRTSGDFY